MVLDARPPLGHGPLLAASVSGLLTALAFPRPEIWPLAFLGLVPLVLTGRGRGPKTAFGLGFLAGLAHNALMLYWLVNVLVFYGGMSWLVSLPIFLLMIGYLALFPGLFLMGLELGEGYFRLRPGHPAWILLGAALYTGLEYFKGFFLTGFPWEPLGAALAAQTTLVQAADLAGPGGLTFLAVLVNLSAAAAILALRGGGKKAVVFPTVLVAAVFGLLIGYGALRLAQVNGLTEAAEHRRVSVAQGSIEQTVKWEPEQRVVTLSIYEELTQRAAARDPWLVVWPETSAPFFFPYDQPASAWLKGMVQKTGRPLLFGAPALEKKEGQNFYYNRAYLLDGRGEVRGEYAKVHLVPYGEYVPLKKFFPFINKITTAAGDFTAGEIGRLLELDGVRMGVLICYESIFTYLSRRAVRNGADLLVVMTNDAWFGRSSAAYQHFAQAVLRAVESRRALIRAANTGISGIILPSGQVIDRRGLFERDVFTGSVPLLKEVTLYTAAGDVLPRVCLGVALAFYLAAIIRRRKDVAGLKTRGKGTQGTR
ncbi:MAG: apolipoprotein N-acyltransferase [Thermodesulfobacteriota bacterium]